MPTTDLTLEGLPVDGDIVGKYVTVQQTRSGRAWTVAVQRETFSYAVAATCFLDLQRQTRLCRVMRNGQLSVIRSWN